MFKFFKKLKKTKPKRIQTSDPILEIIDKSFEEIKPLKEKCIDNINTISTELINFLERSDEGKDDQVAHLRPLIQKLEREKSMLKKIIDKSMKLSVIKILYNNLIHIENIKSACHQVEESLIGFKEELKKTNNPQLIRNERLLEYHIKTIEQEIKKLYQEYSSFVNHKIVKSINNIINVSETSKREALFKEFLAECDGPSLERLNNKSVMVISNKITNILRSYVVLREFFESRDFNIAIENIKSEKLELKTSDYYKGAYDEIELARKIEKLTKETEQMVSEWNVIKNKIKEYRTKYEELQEKLNKINESNKMRVFNENLKKLKTMTFLLDKKLKEFDKVVMEIQNILRKYIHDCNDKNSKKLVNKILSNPKWALNLNEQEFKHFINIIDEIEKRIKEGGMKVNVKKREKILNKIEKIKSIDLIKFRMVKEMAKKIYEQEDKMDFGIINKKIELERERDSIIRRLDELNKEKEEIITKLHNIALSIKQS